MNRSQKPNFNHIRKQLFPPKPAFKIGMRITEKFNTPEELEQHIKEERNKKKKIKRYELELSILENNLTKPRKNYPSRSLWDILVRLILRICNDSLYSHFEDRLYNISKKIAIRD